MIIIDDNNINDNDEQRLATTRRTVDQRRIHHVGRAWDHQLWGRLQQYRMSIFDCFKSKARKMLQQQHNNNNNDNVDALTTYDRLLGFLAARCLQNIHFSYCLRQWKELMLEPNPQQQQQPSTVLSAELENAALLEKYALLICRMQKTPIEIIQEDSFDTSDQRAVRYLDEIAKTCHERMLQRDIYPPSSSQTLSTCSSTKTKLEIINDVLLNEYGFSGNVTDYYNYQNSLLDAVLESKKGIPLTLCILYSCVCRRLKIPVQITGLPGHVVLGFDDHDQTEGGGGGGQRAFMDVFNGGRFLSISDCRDIVASYNVPWDNNFLSPLPTSLVMQRVLNNLSNCLLQGMAADLPFHSDLYFQQRCLSSIHRQSPLIAGPLFDRLAEELPITLSSHLLRSYGLLAENDR